MSRTPTLAVIATFLASAGRLLPQQDPGKVLWTYDAPELIRSSPALSPDGTIYVAALYTVYAITNAGSNKWTFVTQGYQMGSPAVGPDGTVYYTSMVTGNDDSGYLYAINPDGLLKWTYAAKGGGCSPAIGRDGTIYTVGYAYLHAVSWQGSNIWKHLIPGGSSSRYASPILDTAGNLYIGSIDYRSVYAVAPVGTERWSLSTGIPGDSAAIGPDGTIYFAAGSLYAFTPDGTNLWTSSTNDFAHASPVIGQDGTIYSATSGGSLCAFEAGGAFKWQVLTNGYTPGTVPAIDSAGTIYYQAYSTLYAISPAGSVRWSLGLRLDPGDVFGTSRTSPTIGPEGTIYVASANRLYAIAGTNGLAHSSWPMYRQNPRHTGKVEKPALKQPQKRSDANFEFQLYSQLGQTNTVEGTTDLSNWTALTSLVVTSVPMDVVDLSASNYPARFYRASAPP